ncbi:hypothetical protein DXG01_015024 [Tephrocybe rancida]|nr:hypothetical protein DXG01_015024 [Tephrocybe rancida]
MRFSISTVALSAVMLAGFAAASCTSDNDCPRGQTCQFTSTKNSQGECYSRGEGPGAARSRKGRKRELNLRSFDHDEVELAARQVVKAAMEIVAARSFEDAADLD